MTNSNAPFSNLSGKVLRRRLRELHVDEPIESA